MQRYQTRPAPTRPWLVTRRRVLRGGLMGAAGAAFLAAIGCGGGGGGNDNKQGANASPGAGSSGAAVAESPQPGGTLTVSLGSNTATLDVHRTTSYYTMNTVGAALSRLLQFKTTNDPETALNYEIEPDLALSVESPDAVTWTAKLRTDAKFQNTPPVNGHAVEAEDVKATFLRALAAENPGRASLDMIDPVGIQTPDPSTVIFKLKYPHAAFTNTLASPSNSWILPREAQAGAYDPAKVTIGSGPFTLENFTPDVAFTFKKSATWYQKDRPYVDGIRWAIITDPAQYRAQFAGGNLDIVGNSGAQQIAPFDIDAMKRDNPKATVLKQAPSLAFAMVMQLGKPDSPFQDIRMRRALSMAIDRDAIAKAVYNNDTDTPLIVSLGLGKWALKPNQLDAGVAQYYKTNVAEAKKLIQAAGMADRPFKLVYAVNYLGKDYVTTAQTIANMLQGAGHKVTLVEIDYQKDFIAGGKGVRYGNYDSDMIVLVNLAALTEVGEMLFNYFHSDSISNISRLKDPKVDAAIMQARGTLKDEERLKAYQDLQRYLADQMYVVGGIPSPNSYTLIHPRVRNYQYSRSYGGAQESFAKLWIKA